MKNKNIFFLLVLILGAACNPTRFVKPLEKNEKAIGANFGGPLVGFGGATIPIPFTSLVGGYGINDNLTAFGSLHTTALAFGVIQSDLGVLYGFAKPNGWVPGLSASGVANVFVDTWEGNARVLPQLDVNAYWTYGKQNRNFFYTGISNWLELNNYRAHGERQEHTLLFNLQVGHTFVGRKWDFNTEFKYLAPNIERGNIVVDYKGFGQRGAAGIYLGVIRRF
jgi:hypothetical protein